MTSHNKKNTLAWVKKIDWVHEKTPAFWYQDNPLLTHCCNLLSIHAVPGEQFIIKVVRSLKDDIDDPKLKHAVDHFVEEEKEHCYQHARFNNDLKRHQYPVTVTQKIIRLFFSCMYKIMSKKSKIAMIITLEFFAYQYALLATDKGNLPRTDLAAYDLFMWHANEEMGHKSICMTLYTHFKGGYRRRVLVMALYSSFFVMAHLVFIPTFLFVDLCVARRLKRKHIQRIGPFMKRRRDVIRRTMKNYILFYKMGFSI